ARELFRLRARTSHEQRRAVIVHPGISESRSPETCGGRVRTGVGHVDICESSSCCGSRHPVHKHKLETCKGTGGSCLGASPCLGGSESRSSASRGPAVR